MTLSFQVSSCHVCLSSGKIYSVTFSNSEYIQLMGGRNELTMVVSSSSSRITWRRGGDTVRSHVVKISEESGDLEECQWRQGIPQSNLTCQPYSTVPPSDEVWHGRLPSYNSLSRPTLLVLPLHVFAVFILIWRLTQYKEVDNTSQAISPEVLPLWTSTWIRLDDCQCTLTSGICMHM